MPGALDVLLAPEFLEVGRDDRAGLPVAGAHDVIASTHRLYSIHEKIATGRAIYPSERLRRRRASALARRLVAFDALALAREHGTEANAVLLGALAGSGVLPIAESAFRAGDRAQGRRGRRRTSRGFELGFELGRAGGPRRTDPARRLRSNGTRSGSLAESVPADIRTAVEQMPVAVREVVFRGVHRLVDYQDADYARQYLRSLGPFVPPAPASAVGSSWRRRWRGIWRCG